MDLLLLFPPLTEATLFPYLSLPYLAGHVRRSGHSAHQVDLSIELVHRLLDGPALARQARALHAAQDLPTWYRAAVADAALRHLGEVRGFVLTKSPAPRLGPVRAVRLARQAAQLMLRNSALARVWDDFDSLDRAVLRLSEAPVGSLDLATRKLRGLLGEALDEAAPRAVGISVAFFSQVAPALLLARWIRELRPGTPVCLGGQQIMLRHDELAAMASVRTAVDALCVTAGEEPLERWLAHLAGKAPRDDVPGMRWLGPHGVTAPGRPPALRFKDVGAPDYGGLKVHSYLNDTVVLSMVSCVGCFWGRCVFCSYGNRSLARGAYQQASPRQLADTVRRIVESTGIDFVTVVDENTNLRLLARAMRLVRDSGLRVRFNTRNRLEPVLLDPAFCEELAALGCEGMAVGYEGVTQRLLDRLDKGVRAADFQTVLDNLAAAGIRVNLSVMGGLLDETEEEAEESLRFLERNREKFAVDAFELMVVEPGTRLLAEPRSFGVALDGSAAFADNRELNYLGGRVGTRHTVAGGPGRPEMLQRLKHGMRRISAAGAGPAEAAARPPARPTALRPHPWIRCAPPGLAPNGPDGGSFLLADPVREQVYALPTDHVTRGAAPDGLLAATSARGRSLLGKLAAADAGVPCEEPLPALRPSR
ncbi:B12-binding domain-containing radical SAM protein [Streptomyces sp. AN091965]|uniref:B12-binding domain-containing radical SAM protein n=1 Tax=Streptomyces sp. AN091965 TaxID=2927803 RepID=UPI001F619AC9|nr:radical SAM protein [Streptomyces sp. AN091965]MCI3933800.1 radical SAM protein [Streptomyces sp. AN091965]